MKTRTSRLWPSIYEIVAIIFVALVIVLLSNSQQLLSYYGLSLSNQLILTSAHEALQSALKTLDSLSATDGVVTFLIWAVVGVLCFSLVEGLGRAYHELHFEEEVSSRRYIHPATFTRRKFWRDWLIDAFTLTFGIMLLVASLFASLLLILPVGLAYSRLLLFSWSIVNVASFLLGLIIVILNLLIMDCIVRFILFRRLLRS